MDSKAKIFGHAIHPILIVFPLGLLGAAAIFDAIYLITLSRTVPLAAFWMLVAGLIGGVVAALFGFIDWLNIPQHTRAKSVGLYHAIVMDLALVLFAIGLYLRWSTPETPAMIATVCSFAGLAFALVGGWFGGELVERLGVGVSPDANLNAPNSLTHGKAYAIDIREHNLHPTR